MADERLIEHRLDTLESSIAEIRDAIKGIHASLMTLTRLEERHRESREGLIRAHERLDRIEQRLHFIETTLPTLRLTSKWILSAVWGIFAIVGAAVIKLVVL